MKYLNDIFYFYRAFHKNNITLLSNIDIYHGQQNS
jgi:hypothetical protein